MWKDAIHVKLLQNEMFCLRKLFRKVKLHPSSAKPQKKAKQFYGKISCDYFYSFGRTSFMLIIFSSCTDKVFSHVSYIRNIFIVHHIPQLPLFVSLSSPVVWYEQIGRLLWDLRKAEWLTWERRDGCDHKLRLKEAEGHPKDQTH